MLQPVGRVNQVPGQVPACQAIRRQQRGRVREGPTPRPPRRPAAQPPHPRRPQAAAIRAHRAHAELLKGLAAASHGLCAVTARYSLPDLKASWLATAPEVKLLRLSRDAGVLMLQTLGVKKESGTAQEFATLVEDVNSVSRRAEAETRFREAEHRQAEREPAYPLLYSLPGFRYCDLLPAAPERAAWQICLESRL